jgi:phage shock protein PspC (stress-responsive transcriptional regulator)
MDISTSAGTTTTEDPAIGAADYRDGPPPAMVEERLHRIGHGRMVAGVAGGLADYFDVDPTIVRIGFVVLGFMGGLAIPAYLAAWLLIPEEGAPQSVAEELLDRERNR